MLGYTWVNPVARALADDEVPLYLRVASRQSRQQIESFVGPGSAERSGMRGNEKPRKTFRQRIGEKKGYGSPPVDDKT
jgi:hypothetical protein